MNAPIGVAIISALVSIVVGAFTYLSNTKATDEASKTELVRILYKRVEVLESSTEKLRRVNGGLLTLVNELKTDLLTSYEPFEIVKDYLDSKPNPSWVKVVEEEDGDPIFVMWHINPEYEVVFGVSKAFYKGKTDFQVWPEELAEGFYENDLKVHRNLNSGCTTETVPPPSTNLTNEPVEATVCKWATVIDGKDAVAGQVTYWETGQ